MDAQFGKYSEYMVLGYGLATVIIGAMVAWIAARFAALRRQEHEIAQLEAELEAERSARK